MKKLLVRILLFPLGFIKGCIVIANNGARDYQNKIRFKGVVIGNNTSFDNKSSMAPNSCIINNCIINNTTVAAYTYIGSNCLIQNAVINSFCSIANDVIIGLGAHPLDFFSTSPVFYRKNNPLHIQLINQDIPFEEYKKIEIGSDVWIGTRAIIMDGITIGHGAVIGANAVVTKNVPPYAVVAGVPAKVIKYRFSEEKINSLLKKEWWKWNVEKIKLERDNLNRL